MLATLLSHLVTFFSLFPFDLYRENEDELSDIIFVNCCLFHKFGARLHKYTLKIATPKEVNTPIGQ